MKAMIFAAGKGTRLKPLTDKMPKALVQAGGKPLLWWLLQKMARSGIHDIVVNVHHFSEQVVEFLESTPVPGLNIMISDESALLLDTGGGLKKAALLFKGDEPVLVHNVDILSNLDFNLFEQQFLAQNIPAMLAVKDRNTSRKLEFADGRLCGWANENTGETIAAGSAFGSGKRFAFSGISMFCPDFPGLFPHQGVFGLIPACLSLAESFAIGMYDAPHDWLDVGKPETLPAADDFVNNYFKSYTE